MGGVIKKKVANKKNRRRFRVRFFLLWNFVSVGPGDELRSTSSASCVEGEK